MSEITVGNIAGDFSSNIAGGNITIIQNGREVTIPMQLPTRAEHYWENFWV